MSSIYRIVFLYWIIIIKIELCILKGNFMYLPVSFSHHFTQVTAGLWKVHLDMLQSR